MATREEMLSALRNADAAGDAEAATRIAKMLAATPQVAPAAPQAKPAPYQPYQNEVDIGSDTERFGENPGTGAGGAEFHQGIASTPARLVKSVAQLLTKPFGLETHLPDVVNKSAQVAPTGFGTAGRVVGDVAATAVPAAAVSKMTAALPFWKQAAIAAGENAGYGALLSPGEQGNAAAWGAAGGAVAPVFGKVAKALTPTAEAQQLLAKGVPLTYGQRLGPPVQSLENTLARVPYVGAPMRERQKEALQGWQQATRSEAAPGAKTMDEVAHYFSNKYNDLVRDQKFNGKLNVDLNSMVGQSINNVVGSSPAMANRLTMEVNSLLEGVSTPAQFQKAESILKNAAFRYKSSLDPEHKIYGEMLADTAGQLRKTWRERLPLDVQKDLSAVDKAYANFVPIREASSKNIGTLVDPENYTPRALLQAARRRDPSAGKTEFRKTPQGANAIAGEQTIGSSPNAASTGSGIGSLILGGGASALGHTPAAVLASALAAGYGTKPVQQVLTGTLPYQRMLAEALRRGVAPATVAASRD